MASRSFDKKAPGSKSVPPNPNPNKASSSSTNRTATFSVITEDALPQSGSAVDNTDDNADKDVIIPIVSPPSDDSDDDKEIVMPRREAIRTVLRDNPNDPFKQHSYKGIHGLSRFQDGDEYDITEFQECLLQNYGAGLDLSIIYDKTDPSRIPRSPHIPQEGMLEMERLPEWMRSFVETRYDDLYDRFGEETPAVMAMLADRLQYRNMKSPCLVSDDTHLKAKVGDLDEEQFVEVDHSLHPDKLERKKHIDYDPFEKMDELKIDQNDNNPEEWSPLMVQKASDELRAILLAGASESEGEDPGAGEEKDLELEALKSMRKIRKALAKEKEAEFYYVGRHWEEVVAEHENFKQKASWSTAMELLPKVRQKEFFMRSCHPTKNLQHLNKRVNVEKYEARMEAEEAEHIQHRAHKHHHHHHAGEGQLEQNFHLDPQAPTLAKKSLYSKRAKELDRTRNTRHSTLLRKVMKMSSNRSSISQTSHDSRPSNAADSKTEQNQGTPLIPRSPHIPQEGMLSIERLPSPNPQIPPGPRPSNSGGSRTEQNQGLPSIPSGPRPSNARGSKAQRKQAPLIPPRSSDAAKANNKNRQSQATPRTGSRSSGARQHQHHHYQEEDEESSVSSVTSSSEEDEFMEMNLFELKKCFDSCKATEVHHHQPQYYSTDQGHPLYKSPKGLVRMKARRFRERGVGKRTSRTYIKDNCKGPILHVQRELHQDTIGEGFHAYVNSIAGSFWFPQLILLVIMLNAIVLAVETGGKQQTHQVAFDALESVFLSIYLTEFLVKCYSNPIRYFSSGFNVFDFIILVTSLLRAIIRWCTSWRIPYVVNSALTIIRALRIVRCVSLSVQTQVLVSALVETLKNHVLPFLIVLLLLMYVVALIAYNAYAKHVELFDTWGSVPNGMLRLFAFVTMDGWLDLMVEFERADVIASGRVFCLVCIVFGNFFFTSIFTAVINTQISEAIESFKETQRNERESVVFLKEEEVFRRQKLDMRQLLARYKLGPSEDFYDLGSKFVRSLRHDDLEDKRGALFSPLWIDSFYKGMIHAQSTSNTLMNLHRRMSDRLIKIFNLYGEGIYKTEGLSRSRYNENMEIKARLALLKEGFLELRKLPEKPRLRVKLPNLIDIEEHAKPPPRPPPMPRKPLWKGKKSSVMSNEGN